jgi:hypothetical protein
MSKAGSAALTREFHIQARVLPCSAVTFATTPDGDNFLHSMGASHREAHAVAKREFERRWQGDFPALESWVDHAPLDHNIPHYAIEATHRNQKALIDLTAGQIADVFQDRFGLPLDVPGTLSFIYGKGADTWPCFVNAQAQAFVSYGPTTLLDPGNWKSWPSRGIEGEIADLMKIALSCELDEASFRGRLRGMLAKAGA